MKSTQISPTKPAETRQVQSYFFRVMALSVDQHPCMKVLSVIDGKVDIFTVWIDSYMGTGVVTVYNLLKMSIVYIDFCFEFNDYTVYYMYYVM